MSTEYRVTPEYLAGAATQCHNKAIEIEGRMNALRSYVDELGAVWLGVAASTFRSLMDDWRIYAEMLRNSLNDIGSGLQGNYVNYVDMEQANIAALKPIMGNIPPMNLTPVPTGPTAKPADITL